ncbi:hypothetical protein IWZ01DRAFT_262752 [Phyllosticta capitalensis]
MPKVGAFDRLLGHLKVDQHFVYRRLPSTTGDSLCESRYTDQVPSRCRMEYVRPRCSGVYNMSDRALGYPKLGVRAFFALREVTHHECLGETKEQNLVPRSNYSCGPHADAIWTNFANTLELQRGLRSLLLATSLSNVVRHKVYPPSGDEPLRPIHVYTKTRGADNMSPTHTHTYPLSNSQSSKWTGGEFQANQLRASIPNPQPAVPPDAGYHGPP